MKAAPPWSLSSEGVGDTHTLYTGDHTVQVSGRDMAALKPRHTHTHAQTHTRVSMQRDPCVLHSTRGDSHSLQPCYSWQQLMPSEDINVGRGDLHHLCMWQSENVRGLL